MKSYQQFIFQDYRLDLEAKRLDLHYSLDEAVHFTESFIFNFEFAAQLNQEALDRACFGLLMMAGISYYKAYLPPELVVRAGRLSPQQAAFFGTVYRHGLGEFYARNRIKPPERLDFPTEEAEKGAAEPPQVADLKGALVPLGGGKDSLVSLELLRGAGHQFVTWNVAHSNLLAPLVQRVGAPHLPVERQIDPQLLRLNAEGAYNGHVPISAILAFVGVVSALLAGRQDIVLSNEASAGEGNLEYEGLEVNHQYSKTLEFERNFQEYLSENITPSVRYFSLLRPLSELRIAELFCQHWLAKYQGVFTSCNRNFKQGSSHPLFWCGECPKCAFIFLIFAPFLSKQQLLELFGGDNLFSKPKLQQTYRELLGIQGHKPFECVGEIRECRQAVKMARATGNWPELNQYEFPPFEYDYRAFQDSTMPKEYYQIIQKLITD